MNITLDNLKSVVDRINRSVGNPDPKAIGHYYVDNAYGGWMLVQIDNTFGEVHNVTTGYRSKRALYEQLFAFLSGIEAGVEAAQNELKQQINQLTV